MAGQQLQLSCAQSSQESANSDIWLEFPSRHTVSNKLRFRNLVRPQYSLSNTHFIANFVCTTQFAPATLENGKGKLWLPLVKN